MDKQIDVHIKGYQKKGFGVGELISSKGIKDVEIPFTIEGERVKASLVYDRRQIFKAKLLEVVDASDQRTTPRCPHFQECGGCSLQHLSYEGQVALKNQQIKHFFSDSVNLKKIFPMITASNPWRYRNKMDFTFSQDSSGNKFLGLYGILKSRRVIDLDVCYLANAAFIEIKKSVKKWWESTSLRAYHKSSNEGSLRTLTIREGKNTGERQVMLTVSGHPEYALKKNDLASFKELFKNNPWQVVSLFLRIHQIIPGQETEMFEMHLFGKDTFLEQLTLNEDQKPFGFQVSPSAFFQPNTEQAEKLYSTALKWAEVKSSDLLFDLYCGTATLGILAAQYVKKVIGVELSYESALDARENAKFNDINNMEIFQGRVCDHIETLKNIGLPDVIIMDPPREGLTPKVIQYLSETKVKKLILISCHPEKQAIDVKLLIDVGYMVEAIQPIDQFPQTMHIENIVMLSFCKPT